jgi:hypothetical protein
VRCYSCTLGSNDTVSHSASLPGTCVSGVGQDVVELVRPRSALELVFLGAADQPVGAASPNRWSSPDPHSSLSSPSLPVSVVVAAVGDQLLVARVADDGVRTRAGRRGTYAHGRRPFNLRCVTSTFGQGNSLPWTSGAHVMAIARRQRKCCLSMWALCSAASALAAVTSEGDRCHE